MQEILFPLGRLVSGHPMFPSPVKDKHDKPVLNPDGTPVVEFYIGHAVPKGSETGWRQTDWGQKMVLAAQDPVNGYPNGETGAPAFSWKVIDGDSAVPNKKGNKPCDQEGYPGHWVIHMTTRIAYNCFHVNKYEPGQAIKNKDEIKRGDYCRVFANVKGNKPSESPGVYVNPQMFELTRACPAEEEIKSKSSGPSAAAVFGGTPAPVTTPTTPAPVAAPAPAHVAPPPPPPAHDLVTPPPVEDAYLVNGQRYTKSALLAMPGWTEAHLATLQRA